jgi:hypothetical protein
MHPVTLVTQDATRLALLHCRAAQSRSHRHQLDALHTLAILMRSPHVPWWKIAHWCSIATHYEQAARSHQRAAAYFTRALAKPRPETDIQASTTHYST